MAAASDSRVLCEGGMGGVVAPATRCLPCMPWPWCTMVVGTQQLHVHEAVLTAVEMMLTALVSPVKVGCLAGPSLHAVLKLLRPRRLFIGNIEASIACRRHLLADMIQLETLNTLSGHTGRVWCVAWSPDGALRCLPMCVYVLFCGLEADMSP
jgi:hypothetical protein